MSLRSTLIACAVSILAVSTAEARKFDFKSETFATYFGGSYGLSRVKDTPYGSASGTGVSVDKEIKTNASGEFGVAFSGQRFNLKLGAEVLMPRHYSDIKGTDSSGTELFQLDSKIQALIPMANVELLLYQQPTSRLLVGGGYGLAFVTVDNKYTMTADGTAQLGVVDYVEEGKARAQILQTYLGYEFLFTDTTTLSFGLGYRWGLVTGLKSETSVTTIRGPVETGEELKNMDGGVRKMDLGGGFASMNLRFYFF